MATEHSVASLLEENARLREALRPFARVADVYAGRPEGTRLVSTFVGNITIADVRRARRLVAD